MSSVPAPKPFNPWSRSRPLAQSGDEDALTVVQLQYIGIDGHRHTTTAKADKKGELCCLLCLPCCVGKCSEANQQQYRTCTMSFTFVLACIQAILFIASLGVSEGFAPPSINPLLGPCPRALLLLGGMNAALIVHSIELHRLILPVFLHAGVIHIFLNVFAELRFGLYIERRIGIWRVALLYALGTVGGCLLSAVMTAPTVSVGASSALMALMGAHLSETVCKWHATNPLERKVTLVQVVAWIALTLALSALPFVDAGAHIGGLLTGVLCGVALFVHESRWPRPNVILGVSVALLVGYFVAMFLVLFLAKDVGQAPSAAQLAAC